MDGMSNLGDRMKDNYEKVGKRLLTRRTPVIVRVDGRAFHSFTRGADKPFDQNIMDCMSASALHLASEMQGCKFAYVQSDEASFVLTDYDKLTTDAWFGYNQSKVETLSASIMTAAFNSMWGGERTAEFDARAFNIPKEEVANYFLWRAKDWERNSLSMYCRAFFSAKQLKGKGKADQHDLLHSVGKNWATDLTLRERNGTWIIAVERGFKCTSNISPTYQSIAEALPEAI